jgi:hypothetical protein
MAVEGVIGELEALGAIDTPYGAQENYVITTGANRKRLRRAVYPVEPINKIVITSATQMRKRLVILVEMACARTFRAICQARATCFPSARGPCM